MAAAEDALADAVEAEGGTIDKYIGDCVMAFWNAPLDVPDHAARALAAGRRMIGAVAALNSELASRDDWGPDAIRARTERLAAAAIERFAL